MGLLVVENLRQLTRKVQTARQEHNEEAVKAAITEFDESIDR